MSAEIALPVGSDLALRQQERTLTVDEMRGFLLAYLDAHPEIVQGAVLEVWPDGTLAGRLGGKMSQPHYVTTVEYPSMFATRVVL